MATLFSPTTYPTYEAMVASSYYEACSDTLIEGKEVFGYVGDTAYEAVEEWDGDDLYIVVGKPIN